MEMTLNPRLLSYLCVHLYHSLESQYAGCSWCLIILKPSNSAKWCQWSCNCRGMEKFLIVFIVLFCRFYIFRIFVVIVYHVIRSRLVATIHCIINNKFNDVFWNRYILLPVSRKSKSMFVKIWIYSYEGSLNWILSWLILSDISVVARKCFCRDPTTKAFYFYLPHPIELDFHVNLYSNIFSSTYSFLLRRQGVTREMSWTQNYTHNTLLLNAPYLFIYDREKR